MSDVRVEVVYDTHWDAARDMPLLGSRWRKKRYYWGGMLAARGMRIYEVSGWFVNEFGEPCATLLDGGFWPRDAFVSGLLSPVGDDED